MSYGVFQEYYTNPRSSLRLSGNTSSTGTIGTTFNGIVYLSMPVLFGLLARRLSRLRIHALIAGTLLSMVSTVVSAFATNISTLIATQGVLQALGAALLYSASTIYIDEWFIQRKGFAYGVTLASKSAVGVAAPLAFSGSLGHVGYKTTLFIWTGIMALTILPAPFLLNRRIPLSSSSQAAERHYRRTSWSFLRHATFPSFMLANMIFSASYGIPQTYLASFAASTLHFSPSNSALILVAANIPSIFASLWLGPLSDGEKSRILAGRRLSVAAVSTLSALGAAIPIFLLWGMTPSTPYAAGVVLLVLFAMIWGFFAGGYSSTWGGVVKQISREADEHGEVADTGLLFGLMNGARGIGYIIGGLLGVELLHAGSIGQSALAYGGHFGSLILFSGCGAVAGGLTVFIKPRRR